jgi:hypothetical protein
LIEKSRGQKSHAIVPLKSFELFRLEIFLQKLFFSACFKVVLRQNRLKSLG